mgnify:FL=1
MNNKQRISKWVSRGLNHTEEELNEIVRLYHTTTNCHLCDKLLTDKNCGSQKCMDHDHKTGKFRYILCKSCNIHFDSKKRIIHKRYTEEQLKENQKIANRKFDLKRKNDPKRIEYNKQHSKKYREINREKKLKQDIEYHRYRCSWGGDKRSNCNLLEISLDIFHHKYRMLQ